MLSTNHSPAPAINEQKDYWSNLTKSQQVEMIPVFKSELSNDLMVDARELHKRLKVKTRFDMWIQRRIEEYDFKEGLEFCTNLGKTSKNSKGGRPSIEYQLTIFMAQELCLLDNSEFGKAIRLYLLQHLKNSQDKLHIFKNVPYMVENGIKYLNLMEVRKILGYSVRSSTSNVRRRFAQHIIIYARTAWVTEEYAYTLLKRAEARDEAIRTMNIVPASNQLTLDL